MYKILGKQKLTADIDRFEVEAPLIARKAAAGQFVMVRIDEQGERIPLTIADFDQEKGIISLVSMIAGKSTDMFSRMEQGESLADVVGPLGKPSEIEKFGNVVCVGGGVGIAPIMPIARALKQAGNYIVSIIGARNSDGLILEKEMDQISDQLYICTDDGSKGFGGFVSDFLDKFLEGDQLKVDRVVAIGPAPMMAAVSKVTKPYGIKTIVSLNSIMVDGTGMCGACRVEVGKKTKFVCVDGPEFDGHQVDFDLLFARQKMYCDQEQEAYQGYQHECRCKQNS
ncbi:MAG: sulfide/dihydroorotate dehydrogenase-like FAD/NAD-binding protein [Actinomycetota bacterium]|nr:sulfide/dihydroorotate dehydrogenase-like FAD/NAD-binding protein [Actinomycetota bacterium]